MAATPVRGRARFFATAGPVADGCHVDGDRVVERSPGAAPVELFARADVPLPGPHNLENAMAAALLARAVGAAPADLAPALAAFRGLPHRLERVAERDGVVFFDDSKGTNVGATLRSLEGFSDGSVHLILGGRDKGADLSLLRPMVARKARRVYLVGEAADELAAALAGAVAITRSGRLEIAVAEAARQARGGETVLLSPACASFDQFRDFVERGRRFQECAREAVGEVA